MARSRTTQSRNLLHGDHSNQDGQEIIDPQKGVTLEDDKGMETARGADDKKEVRAADCIGPRKEAMQFVPTLQCQERVTDEVCCIVVYQTMVQKLVEDQGIDSTETLATLFEKISFKPATGGLVSKRVPV